MEQQTRVVIVNRSITFAHVSPSAHAIPQPPQFIASCATHAPPQQSSPRAMPAGAAHSSVPQRQAPIVHVVPAGHMRPHMPQLASSPVVSTQRPPQQPCPIGHAAPVPGHTHMPIEHVSPLAHA